MKEEITRHLINKYEPTAIILHGSRAGNFAQSDSDWDLYVFVNDGVLGGVEKYKNQQLDIDIVSLPFSFSDPMKRFGTSLRYAEILFDSQNFAKDLLANMKAMYDQFSGFSKEQVYAKQLFLERALVRLNRYSENKMLFHFYAGSLFRDVVRLWFEVGGRWPEPAYKAISIIADKDPDFYQHLEVLVEERDSEKIIAIYKGIYSRLFKGK